MGADLQALQVAAPRLSAWLDNVFTVMGGFMAGAGVLIAYFGWVVMPLRLRGTMIVLMSTGALTLGLMSAVNFVLHSDFRWLLVLPPIGWAVAVLLIAASQAALSIRRCCKRATSATPAEHKAR
jgi:hypothetical protein